MTTTHEADPFAEYERELEAAAQTPERIKADAEGIRRASERMDRELERLRAQGMIATPGEDEDEA